MENLSSTDVLGDESIHPPPPKASNRKLIGLSVGLITTCVLAFGGVLSETAAQVLEVVVGSFMVGNSIEHVCKKASSKPKIEGEI